MSAFEARIKDFPEQQSVALTVDRLFDEIDKQLESPGDISSIKAAIFNIVVLSALLEKLGVKKHILNSDLKDIRDSVLHIDERIDNFDQKPLTIKTGEWDQEETPDGKFKISAKFNFQGPIGVATINTSGVVKVIAPYGMVGDYFIWINREGRQVATPILEIKETFKKLTELASEDEKVRVV